MRKLKLRPIGVRLRSYSQYLVDFIRIWKKGLIKVKKNTMYKYTFVLVLILASGLLTACNTKNNVVVKANEIEDVAVEANETAMGTVISQKVYGANGQVAIDKAFERIKYLETLLTFNASEGDIYNLNQNAGKNKVELNPITIKVMRKAQQVAELSQGAFDITIGPLVKSWGIGTGNERIPSEEELHNLLPLTDYKDLEIDDHTAFLKNPGQMVDLGGIAKGYAGDEAIEIYKNNGIKSAFINLGGNVVTLGSKPDGSPWTVGIRNPRKEEAAGGDQIIGTVKVRNKAVVTAGDGERFVVKDGTRYHHILDPHTGYPAQSDLMSVTLVTDSSFDADALDTAVFILGFEKGKALLQEYGGIEAIFITTDKKIYVTDGLKSSFNLLEGSNDYQVIE